MWTVFEVLLHDATVCANMGANGVAMMCVQAVPKVCVRACIHNEYRIACIDYKPVLSS